MVSRYGQMVYGFMFLFILFSFLLVSQNAEGAHVYFPSNVKDATAANAENILGSPDDDYTLFNNGASATYYQFNEVENYDNALFSSALGISENVLGNADFIAFDWNNGGGGFETSTWLFTDGVSSVDVSHTYSSPASGIIMSNSDMSLADFNSLFGSNYPLNPSDDVGFLLFDLSSTTLDLSSQDFEVQITGGIGYEGYSAPDIIGLGRFVVPIPGAIWLFGSGIAGLVVIRRKKQL